MTHDIKTTITRLETLTGPDREVDAEIMFDLFAVPTGKAKDGGPRGYLWPDDDPSWSFGIRFPGKSRDWFDDARRRRDGNKETLVIERDGALVLMNDLRILPLTKSVEAALTLVPKGLRGYLKWDEWGGECVLIEPSGRAAGEVDAATPAIALCIAALKAREADNA